MNTTRQRRRAWRPLLEALEDRLTPATYTVNSIGDTGAGSGLLGDLRYCITRADADPGSLIVFDQAVFATAQTITLGGSALPDLSQSMQITGPAAGVTVNAGRQSRVLAIDSGAAVAITNLTITRGQVGNSGGGILNSGTLTLSNCTVSDNRGDPSGGGINNSGTLNLNECTINDNTVGGGGPGGGILNSGTATLTNCTLSGNYIYGSASGGSGGGIANGGTLTLVNCILNGNEVQGGFFGIGGRGGGINNSGTATLVNCTLSGNTADGSHVNGSIGSGGIGGSGGGIANSGALTLTNCTLSGNVGGDGSQTIPYPPVSGTIPGDSGGIANSGTATLNNTIVAGNRATTMPDVSGGGTLSAAFCLIGDGTGSGLGGGNGNLIGTSANPLNALLAPLGSYGGPTPTLPLLPGSPALDAGSNALALDASGQPLAADQRGSPRTINNTVDIGAVESQGFTLSVLAGANQTTPAGTAFPTVLAVRVTANDAAEPVQGGVVTFTAPAAGPSAAFASGQATATASIDARGTATATALTANGVPGSYAVTASAAGAVATFPLTNGQPLSTNERFAAHLYQDLLGRPGSPAEVSFFGAVLDQGFLTQGQLATFFFHSFEYHAHQADQLYLRLLGRHVDTATQAAAALYLAGGGSPVQLEAIVLGSDEYYQLHGGTDAGFLAGLGKDVLSGSLDPAGLALFQAELAAGTPRYVVALQVMGAPQAAVAEANRLYQEVLGRPASGPELLFPAMYILGGNETEVLLALLLSEEYAKLP
jgi:hypothetical protein